MKTIIRQGTFETNSSSTHSMTIVMAEDYDKFRKGELLINTYHEKIVSYEEAIEKVINGKYSHEEDREKLNNISREDHAQIYEILREYDYRTYNEYEEDNEYRYLESFFETFTTPNGEEIVVFGEYGNE